MDVEPSRVRTGDGSHDVDVPIAVDVAKRERVTLVSRLDGQDRPGRKSSAASAQQDPKRVLSATIGRDDVEVPVRVDVDKMETALVVLVDARASQRRVSLWRV
jgi:uncharacterized protein (DUF1800 family)